MWGSWRRWSGGIRVWRTSTEQMLLMICASSPISSTVDCVPYMHAFPSLRLLVLFSGWIQIAFDALF